MFTEKFEKSASFDEERNCSLACLLFTAGSSATYIKNKKVTNITNDIITATCEPFLLSLYLAIPIQAPPKMKFAAEETMNELSMRAKECFTPDFIFPFASLPIVNPENNPCTMRR